MTIGAMQASATFVTNLFKISFAHWVSSVKLLIQIEKSFN